MKAFHCSYYLFYEESGSTRLACEMEVLYRNEWVSTYHSFGDGVIGEHARLLRQAGVPDARSFARDARDLRFGFWQDEPGRIPDKTPFWTNNEWVCIGVDGMQSQLIHDVRWDFRSGCFHLEIALQAGTGFAVFPVQYIPEKDMLWICAEFLKVAGWNSSSAEKEAQKIKEEAMTKRHSSNKKRRQSQAEWWTANSYREIVSRRNTDGTFSETTIRGF